MIKCSNCGYLNDDDSLFCEECGERLEKEEKLREEAERRRKIAEERYEKSHAPVDDYSDDFDEDAFDEDGNYIGG